MKLFKNKVSGDLTERLNSFYNEYANEFGVKENMQKANRMEGRILAGLSIAGAGTMYGIVGIVTAASAPMLVAGVSLAGAALAYSAISKLSQKYFESKFSPSNKSELDEKSTNFIKKYAEEFNLDYSVLKDIKGGDGNLMSNPVSKETFKSRLAARLN